MRETVDFTSWIAGWTALAFVVAYGIFLIRRSSRLKKALDAVPSRILVTGSRGKSGTVRLIHEILRRSGQSAYGKVTGTVAVELYPDGSEHETVRLGAASVNEMPEAMMRSASLGASVGVFECMAVSPDLITMVSNSHIRPRLLSFRPFASITSRRRVWTRRRLVEALSILWGSVTTSLWVSTNRTSSPTPKRCVRREASPLLSPHPLLRNPLFLDTTPPILRLRSRLRRSSAWRRKKL